MLEEKYNRYGTLVTVASLMFIVVYACGEYDGWDLMVSSLGGFFGISYLKNKAYFDWFSRFLGSLIASSGVVIALKSMQSLRQLLLWY